MKLTTRSRYGTRLMLDMAQHGADGPVRIKDIAERQDVSVKYLEKLVRELKIAGLVASRRGPRGGHLLAKSVESIHVGDIVRILEGEVGLVDCQEHGRPCPRQKTCPTRRVWIEAAKAMLDRLDAISLADLLDPDGRLPTPQAVS